MTWQIAFGVIQTVFIFALGWFIKLLIGFSCDLKKTNDKITTVESAFNAEIAQLKSERAVAREREKNIFAAIERLENKFDSIVEVKIKE